MAESLQRIVTGSSLCEVFWADSAGWPRAIGAMALWWEDAPALAFTYASADRARAIARSPTVLLTLTESRSTGAAFTPTAIRGRPHMVEDLDGDVFAEHLLTQELRRYPPARTYADSLLLRRENWWYLPRLIVRIEVDSVRAVVARTEPDEHVLAVAPIDNTQPSVVRVVTDAANMSATLEPLTGSALPDGPAVAIGQDASFPDIEQWSTWAYRGRMSAGRLALSDPHPRPGLVGVSTLWQRIRFRRTFGRACRAGISAARQADGAEGQG